MKPFICCLVSLCVIANAGIAQNLSFLNLTANKITSDTVFIGITNELTCKQPLAGVKFHSANASVVVDDGILKVKPQVRGKLIIEYHSNLFQGRLILNATVLPAPTPVVRMELSPVTNTAVRVENKLKLEVVLPGCSERLNQYEVVSYKAKVAGELIRIDGNRILRELLNPAGGDPLANAVTIESVEVRPGTSFRSFSLNRQYSFAIK